MTIRARWIEWLRYLKGVYEYDIKRKEAELDELRKELTKIDEELSNLTEG